jgi:hypothetical protein
MNTCKEGVAIWRLDDSRYAVGVDHVIRYVGSQEECQRRANILSAKNDRKVQDLGLVRARQRRDSILKRPAPSGGVPPTLTSDAPFLESVSYIATPVSYVRLRMVFLDDEAGAGLRFAALVKVLRKFL